MATASASSGSNGFFSTITSGISTLTNSLSTLVPVWSQAVAASHKTNQLADPTVNQAALPPNLNGLGGIGTFIKSSPITAAAIGLGIAALGVVLLKAFK